MVSYGFHHLNSINSSIRELYSKLGSSRVSVFTKGLHGPDFHTTFRKDQIIQVQHIARRIVDHYQLHIGSVVVSLKDNLENVANVDLSASSDFFIEVKSEASQNSDDLLAVIAHEITHIFLHRIGLSFADENENEILTDTAATYLGLGTLILNGYTERKTTTKWFGYLTPVEFGYILAKRTKRFDDDPKPHLKSDARDAFYSGLAKLESEYRLAPYENATRLAKFLYLCNRKLAALKWKSDTAFLRNHKKLGYIFEGHNELLLILKCNICSQKLRIPVFRNLISVRCPMCESIFNRRT